MIETLSDERLHEIRERAKCASWRSADDLRDLLAEVTRLRAEVERLRKEYDLLDTGYQHNVRLAEQRSTRGRLFLPCAPSSHATQGAAVTPFFRPNTNDAEIWDAVYSKNGYRLPDDMQDWRVLDVGAHIGSFSRAACERGASVRAFEPAMECVHPFATNTLGCDVLLSCTAVMASSGRVKLVHCPIPGERSGHSVVIPHPENAGVEWVEATAFADILAGHEVDLCKLDVEGTEYHILLHLPFDVLRLVKRYVIEFHAFDHFSIPWKRMEWLDYRVRWKEESQHFVTAWFDREDV